LTSPQPAPSSRLARFTTFLREPPIILEAVLWLVLTAAVVGIRLYIWHLLPTYLWSGDGDSYAHAAFHWFETGEMIFDGRRGPTYSLLIAAALKLFGRLDAVIWLQEALGGLSILAVVAVARSFFGRAALWPLMACAIALAFYGLPLHLAHLLRNETLLFFFSSVALCAWWPALRSNSKGWLFVAAVSAALGTMTKNVFVPLPLMFAAGVIFASGLDWRARGLRLAVIAAGFILPFAALKLHDATAAHVEPPQPQAGILFYGRTAQWTKFDGGIEPELKELIRADIEDYRRLPKLDNNIIIKRTAVPHLWLELAKRGETPTDLDRLCRRFAVEAVRTHPAEFWRQICGDLFLLHFVEGVKNEFPHDSHLRGALKELEGVKYSDPAMLRAENRQILEARIGGHSMGTFHRLLEWSWMFQYFPVLATTLALPVLILCLRGKERWFFLGNAAVWFFNMVLLSTVGRPLERYLTPLVPIMFWAQSGVLILLWNWLLRRASGLTSPVPSHTTGAPLAT
jgi:hypothetical protein